MKPASIAISIDGQWFEGRVRLVREPDRQGNVGIAYVKVELDPDSIHINQQEIANDREHHS